MGKIRKKIAGIIAVMGCAAAIIMPLGGGNEAQAAEATPMDMYLIAGQSNAAGYSKFKGAGKTYKNVWYAGQTDRESYNVSAIKTSSDNTQSYASFRQSVEVGLGKGEGYIGPEYGMAGELSKQATAEHPAFIFKTAAGSTSLLDRPAGGYGNWYPRSLWEEGYTPNVTTVTNDDTGIMYQLFLSNFERVYKELVSHGYAPKVKGMAWMQGEAESADPSLFGKYKETLKVFISDIRADLTEITGDKGLKTMPFVIGEIAPTFGYYGNGNAKKLTEYQRQVAAEMKESRVSSFSTDDLIINNADESINGTDKYHYSANDAKTLGQRFASGILNLVGKKEVIVKAENGTATGKVEGDNYKVTLTPKENYKLSQVLFNGVDVTSEVKENVYSTKLTEDSNELVVKFVEKNKYAVEYEASETASCQSAPKSVYEGAKLSLKIYPNKGYEITKVYYNESEMKYNEKTKSYEIMAKESGKVRIETQRIGGTGDGNADNTETKEGGCKSSAGIYGVIPAMVLACVGVIIAKKRKN